MFDVCAEVMTFEQGGDLLTRTWVQLSHVDAITFHPVTRDNRLFLSCGHCISFLREVPTQNSCTPDRPGPPPALLTSTEVLEQEQPLDFPLATVTVGLWSSCCSSSGSSCRKELPGVLLCPPVW